MEELNLEDFQSLLALVEQANWSGKTIEQAATLKAKLLRKIKTLEKK